MESDLQLREISGEDDGDSLLTPLPDTDTSANDFASFSAFISPLRGLQNGINPVKPGSSSRRGCRNKENIHTDKAETPKLSVEPLHMKRKKRGGGYNLRKSLAWDRAFSTEEGVLDPIELSLLSGTLHNTCGEALFTINEEERNRTSNDSCNANSAYLNSIEKNKQKASSKVPASHNGKTISKFGGCSRPLSSPSLKRPANLNHVKSAIKDSKLPKFQVTKQSSRWLPTSSRSTFPRTSHLKLQVTDSAVSIQKNAGLRSSSRKERNGQEKAKPDAEPLKDKSSLCVLRGNDEKSTSQFRALTKSLPPVSKTSNKGLTMKPESIVPSSQAQSSQSTKSSGLRMPSPTLGYFHQTKASDTHRLLKAESSMYPSQWSGDLRPSEALARQKGNEKLANLNCRILGLRSESSTTTCKVVKTGSEGNTVERSNIPRVIKKFDPVSDKPGNHSRNLHAKAHDHNVELLMNGEQHPPHIGKLENINKDIDFMNSIPGIIEDKGSAGSDFRDSQSPQANCKIQPVVPHGLEGAVDNADEAEKSGSRSVTDDSICRTIMKIKSNLSNVQRELRKKESGNCESSSPTGSDISEEKMKISEVASQHENPHNLKEACTGKQITDRAQTGGLVGVQSCETLSDEKYETNFGLSIYSKHESHGCDVLDPSDLFHNKHVSVDQSQDERVAETGLSGLRYRQDESGIDSFDVTPSQTEVQSDIIIVVGEDAADIICFSPVKITLAETYNHSADEEFNYGKALANSSTSPEFGSLPSGTRDPMVLSAVPGSIGECGRPIKEETVLEVMDEAEICHSSNCHNEGYLTTFMESGSSSRGTQYETDAVIPRPICEGNRPIKDVHLLAGVNEPEIRDSSNSFNDGNQIIKLVDEHEIRDSSEVTSKNSTETVTTDPIELVKGDKVVDTLDQDILVNESETGKSTSESSGNELFHGVEDSDQGTNDNTSLLVNKTESLLKKGNFLILPPPDAVPFSDEWLAAIEAAGEDILTKKGGAVQNSPPEKSLPEPSPWSPVKKKNNQLGPYDCTKFNHNLPPES